MTDELRDQPPRVRELARQGMLADTVKAASAEQRRRLRREAYDLLHPVVFGQLTSRIEARRGHRDCLVAISALRPECLDRFHDDMDAVLEDLFRNAGVPIYNLEGWVSSRMNRATVDAYRRRRGSRGALQRPRIPRWLARELDHDERLLRLAIDMLEWVGVEVTAGVEDWPVQTWAARRASQTGDYDSAQRSVHRDIATVLAAMRTNPRWYCDYVERPMGRKRFPLAMKDCGAEGSVLPQSAIVRDTGVADDDRRAALAALAVAVIAGRLERGDELRDTVVEVITTLFSSGTAADALDRVPGQASEDHEVVNARLADPQTVDRIITVVLELLES